MNLILIPIFVFWVMFGAVLLISYAEEKAPYAGPIEFLSSLSFYQKIFLFICGGPIALVTYFFGFLYVSFFKIMDKLK